ncbi:1-(5-phosphoribosyl)-5-[(5-phosphoribosylamino)methylideneamino]imidazole-4-carboxamide isomerase [Camelliibacillus cellulosilyticus]|uniref:1-(5-phosphoribosyl)-5-[(5-phosphoribosylamino)methylideneamino] imidazole-4-carboxamide isomerase n=1 Tax=Camelliibacillus cellulosilyticus TaxID=2174486 RepID=A0ABV9GKD0_9BACL
MNGFTVYPAIDIRGAKCVRLVQGDYRKETVYDDSPFAVAKRFVDEGAKWLHIVDLDGAKAGHPVNAELILQIVRELPVSVQIGGGIRTKEDVNLYLINGADRVILGSSAINRRAFTRAVLSEYGQKVVISLDAKADYVATEGWQSTSKVRADELVRELSEAGASRFIFTDISKDGMLLGPNVQAIGDLCDVTDKDIIASGGVHTLQDLIDLKHHRGNVSGAIVGKALYTGQFTLPEALEAVALC